MLEDCNGSTIYIRHYHVHQACILVFRGFQTHFVYTFDFRCIFQDIIEESRCQCTSISSTAHDDWAYCSAAKPQITWDKCIYCKGRLFLQIWIGWIDLLTSGWPKEPHNHKKQNPQKQNHDLPVGKKRNEVNNSMSGNAFGFAPCSPATYPISFFSSFWLRRTGTNSSDLLGIALNDYLTQVIQYLPRLR